MSVVQSIGLCCHTALSFNIRYLIFSYCLISVLDYVPQGSKLWYLCPIYKTFACLHFISTVLKLLFCSFSIFSISPWYLCPHAFIEVYHYWFGFGFKKIINPSLRWLLLFLTASASLLLTLRGISSLVFSFVAFDGFLRYVDFSLTFWLIKCKAHNVLSTVLSYYITEKLNSLRFFSFRYCLILGQVIL